MLRTGGSCPSGYNQDTLASLQGADGNLYTLISGGSLFLGGSNNLRGFDFRDVGPRDANGEPLGGKTLARATIEYTFPLIEKARGALFYDTGFVNST